MDSSPRKNAESAKIQISNSLFLCALCVPSRLRNLRSSPFDLRQNLRWVKPACPRREQQPYCRFFSAAKDEGGDNKVRPHLAVHERGKHPVAEGSELECGSLVPLFRSQPAGPDSQQAANRKAAAGCRSPRFRGMVGSDIHSVTRTWPFMSIGSSQSRRG